MIPTKTIYTVVAAGCPKSFKVFDDLIEATEYTQAHTKMGREVFVDVSHEPVH